MTASMAAAPRSGARLSPRLAILDRDGTLIDVMRDEETGAVNVAFHPDHLRLLPGVVDGLRTLRDAGYLLALATNQPGPAKGQCSRAAVERTNDALVAMLADHGLAIARVAVCMHHPHGGVGGDPALRVSCGCRKPEGGLLIELLQRLDVDASQAIMIGDSAGDIAAAHNAGIRGALVFSKNRCELCPLRAGPSTAVLGQPNVIWGGTFDEVARKVVFMDREAHAHVA